MLNPFFWKISTWDRWTAHILGYVSRPKEFWILARLHQKLLQSEQMQIKQVLINNLRLQMSCIPALSSGSTQASAATTFRASSTDSCSEKCNHLNQRLQNSFQQQDTYLQWFTLRTTVSPGRGKKPAYPIGDHRCSFTGSNLNVARKKTGFTEWAFSAEKLQDESKNTN